MQIPSTIKFMEACTNPGHSDWQKYVLLQEGCLLGTNGRICAVVPIQIDPADNPSILLPPNVKPGWYAAAGDKLIDKKGNTTVLPDESPSNKPIQWQNIMPTETEDRPLTRLTLDADLLYRLAKAICNPSRQKDKRLPVTLIFRQDDDQGNVRVEPACPVTDGAVGIIARCR